ncbi:HAD family hydrolase [Natrinema salaciae]|uniref:Putative hydrolase of the HAD superfamily n=1 Tax=Natrinema salaciae TaxID=1186196 RepID=A0A1H9H1W8_9EURY|nr:HAD family hydrolase [Natrinema salaciae]SEQ56316.1 putative hydrolase of the HAD superfamily [Natrinema salaciae]
MSGIEAVCFDLDGTPLRYRRSPAEVLQASFERVGVDPLFPVEDYYERYDEFARQCDSMAELRSECFGTLAVENGCEASLGRAVATAFDAERDQSNVELYPRVPAVLETLSQRYEIGIVTNGTRDAQRRKIEAVGIEQWIDTIVIAGQDPPPKPASEPFERALDSLDATPATTVHVGDSREADISGATNAGLDSVWISGSGTDGSVPTYRVTSIGNLLPPPWESSDS